MYILGNSRHTSIKIIIKHIVMMQSVIAEHKRHKLEYKDYYVIRFYKAHLNDVKCDNKTQKAHTY